MWIMMFAGVEKGKVAHDQANWDRGFHKVNTMMMMVWKF